MSTCLEFALSKLQSRAITPGTLRAYLSTLKALDIEHLDVQSLNPMLVTERLSRILTPSTRRKHAVNMNVIFGIKVRTPRPTHKFYDLPPTEVLHDALIGSRVELQGLAMLYAGLRLGEACVNQTIRGTKMLVDRQKSPDNHVVISKTFGEVVVQDWFADMYESNDFDKHPHSVYMGIRGVLKRKTGLYLTPHSLRHAFATQLVKDGASPEVLKRQMRHSDIALAWRFYVQTTESDIQRVVDLQQMCRGDACRKPYCRNHGHQAAS